MFLEICEQLTLSLSQLGLNETASTTEDSLSSILYITRWPKNLSHNLAFWIVKYLLLILNTIKLVRVAFFIRVGVKDVGRYRYFSKRGKETKLWKWFRCVELDYSQDKINIDYDYGDRWMQETDKTETTRGNREDGEPVVIVFKPLESTLRIVNKNTPVKWKLICLPTRCLCFCSWGATNTNATRPGMMFLFMVVEMMVVLVMVVIIMVVKNLYWRYWRSSSWPGEASGEHQKCAMPSFSSSSSGHFNINLKKINFWSNLPLV